MLLEKNINPSRVNLIREGVFKKGPIIYWMQRDQRVNDNWALLYAQELALKQNLPLCVVFCLVNAFNNAAYRQYAFMLKGLQKAEKEFNSYNIPFVLLSGEPEREIPRFVKEISAGTIVIDFNPIKIVRQWKQGVKENIDIPFYEVDAHNIVPCRIASDKPEFAAYTIRPKINKLLDEYLEEFPPLVKMKNIPAHIKNNWDETINSSLFDSEVKEINRLQPGEDEALKALQNFINIKFARYAVMKNNPAMDASSNLSPYFHFGQMAPQRAALAVQRLTDYPDAQKSFLEELIIRRELADNFCYYNPDYDSFSGFHQWAKETLSIHRKDKREFVYSVNEFENGVTHDKLWNAAQIEMVKTGKMHGYLRMYWAKKILEWSKTPEDAIKAAIYLNDKYELDGRDPNGYAGIAWSVGGVHDRAWGERSIFGKVRYMNYNGCRRKFDVDLYINKINSTDE
jgi:deoxyribodipyrimidine photo-lyase